MRSNQLPSDDHVIRKNETQRRHNNYIPSTKHENIILDNLSFSTNSDGSDDEGLPLLDISNDIERRSEDWPIDPEGNSVILSDSSRDHLHLTHPFGRPKRLLLEVFIMINMAELMYTAMLTFAKSAMLQQGASVVNLALYRAAVVFAIHFFRQIFFSQNELPKEDPRDSQRQQYHSPMYEAWINS